MIGGPIPGEWLNGDPVRVILHWTAGTYEVSDLDRQHYHFLIDGAGKVHRGRYSLADNASCRDGRYAAHTRGMNTGSAGIAICGMGGATHPESVRGFNPGRWPFNQTQWQVAQACAAQVLAYADLPADARTCFSHWEAQALHGVRQRGKWDISVLPWDPGLDRGVVMAQLRGGVATLLGAEPTVLINGNLISHAALLEGGRVWLWIRPIAEWFDWHIEDVEPDQVRLLVGADPDAVGTRTGLPARIVDGRAWVPARELVPILSGLGWRLAWDQARNRLAITTRVSVPTLSSGE
ncbi:MAG: N-acetylmuramoyl-L-alanine amidase [Armatimonadetes bacterium]|nr:N-acetylmuramoyl-L-alanine amidase [Armatimonadota bacterium]